ncbi:hypothetical protein D5071_07870 [Pectobacterium carotovorum]|uniref:Uncharacterized protein n=2 Tax=Pectobacterium carotovorum TaxID=554 RepID=A0A419AY82_PECCA|nr:hypothetical protein D5071_07870 [Pectobacterium carotovorum]
MLLTDSISDLSSVSRTLESTDSPSPEASDSWFDAIDYIEMEDTWFDACESHHTSPTDSLIPFTEDCRRSVQQLIRTLGEHCESKMLSVCLSKILPSTPTSLVIAANSLYTAITEQRNIDTAVLHALGLASWCLPDDINIVSCLAEFIRETVTSWTDKSFLQHFLGNEENHASTCLFTALAVTTIVARRWIKDESAPQRGLLKVPAFIANILIRASYYWNTLGNMARSPLSDGEIPENAEPPRHVPAFEVDTVVEMTEDVCDTAVLCSSSAPLFTAFSSNSTTKPGAYFRATVRGNPISVSRENHRLPVPEQAHFLAVDKLRQESRLSDLLYCATQKTETRQKTNEKIVTAAHFNTKCDAITYPEPLTKKAENLAVHTDILEMPMSSPAAGRDSGDTLLPLVITATVTAAAPVSYMQALKSKTVIATGLTAGLTGLIVGGKLLRDRIWGQQPKTQRGIEKLSQLDFLTEKRLNKNSSLIDWLVYKNKIELYTFPTEKLPSPGDNFDSFILTDASILNTQYGYAKITRSFLDGNAELKLNAPCRQYGKSIIKIDSDNKKIMDHSLGFISEVIINDIIGCEFSEYYGDLNEVFFRLMDESLFRTTSQNYLDVIADFYWRVKNIFISNDESIIKKLSEMEFDTYRKIKVDFNDEIASPFIFTRGPIIGTSDDLILRRSSDVYFFVKEILSDGWKDKGSIKALITGNESILNVNGEFFLCRIDSEGFGEIVNRNEEFLSVKFYRNIGWGMSERRFFYIKNEDGFFEPSLEKIKKYYIPFIDDISEVIPELDVIIESALMENREKTYDEFLRIFIKKIKEYISNLVLDSGKEEAAALFILMVLGSKLSSINSHAGEILFGGEDIIFKHKFINILSLYQVSKVDVSFYNQAVLGVNDIGNKIYGISRDIENKKKRIEYLERMKKYEKGKILFFTGDNLSIFMIKHNVSVQKDISEINNRWNVEIEKEKSNLKILQSDLFSLKKEKSLIEHNFKIINEVVSEFDNAPNPIEGSDRNNKISFEAYSKQFLSSKGLLNCTEEDIKRNEYRIIHHNYLGYLNELYNIIRHFIIDDDISWDGKGNILDIDIAMKKAGEIYARAFPQEVEDDRSYIIYFISAYILYKHDHKGGDCNLFEVMKYYNEKGKVFLGQVFFTDFLAPDGYVPLVDFLPGSFFSSRRMYTDQFSNYQDNGSVDYDVKIISNTILLNAKNLPLDDLILPPKRVAYYNHSGGEVKRSYGKQTHPDIGFYGFIECDSGNYLVINSFFGNVQVRYLSSKELGGYFSLDENSRFGFERQYGTFVSGDYFGEEHIIKIDPNKRYESIIHRVDYFQEFHGKDFIQLRDAISSLVKKYIIHSATNYKEKMDNPSMLAKTAGFILPFFNEIYGGLTDKYHQYDTDGIIMDAFYITSLLTSAGLSLYKVSSQGMESIAQTAFYYRRSGLRGIKLAEAVLADSQKVWSSIMTESVFQLKKIMIDILDPTGIVGFIKEDKEKVASDMFSNFNNPKGFYSDLHNFAKPVTTDATEAIYNGYRIIYKNGNFKAKYDYLISAWRLVGSHRSDVPLRLNKNNEWEVDYEIYSKEKLIFIDKASISSSRENGNTLKENKSYSQGGRDEWLRNYSTKMSHNITSLGGSHVISNAKNGATVTKREFGSAFNLYSWRDENKVVKPADRIFVIAYEDAIVLKRKFTVPSPEERVTEFLVPYRERLEYPSVDIINIPYLEFHSQPSQSDVSAGNMTMDGSPHTHTDVKSITGLSNPEMGEARNYNLNYFDGDTEQGIATAIDYNRSEKKHPYVPVTDVITVRNKLSHELVEPTLSKLIRELKEVEHPATVISICICREYLFQEKMPIEIEIYNYHVNDGVTELVSSNVLHLR